MRNGAFGLGEDALRIGTIDADGVALAGVEALDARTRAFEAHGRAEIEALRTGVAALPAETAALRELSERNR